MYLASSGSEQAYLGGRRGSLGTVGENEFFVDHVIPDSGANLRYLVLPT